MQAAPASGGLTSSGYLRRFSDRQYKVAKGKRPYSITVQFSRNKKAPGGSQGFILCTDQSINTMLLDYFINIIFLVSTWLPVVKR